MDEYDEESAADHRRGSSTRKGNRSRTLTQQLINVQTNETVDQENKHFAAAESVMAALELACTLLDPVHPGSIPRLHTAQTTATSLQLLDPSYHCDLPVATNSASFQLFGSPSRRHPSVASPGVGEPGRGARRPRLTAMSQSSTRHHRRSKSDPMAFHMGVGDNTIEALADGPTRGVRLHSPALREAASEESPSATPINGAASSPRTQRLRGSPSQPQAVPVRGRLPPRAANLSGSALGSRAPSSLGMVSPRQSSFEVHDRTGQTPTVTMLSSTHDSDRPVLLERTAVDDSNDETPWTSVRVDPSLTPVALEDEEEEEEEDATGVHVLHNTGESPDDAPGRGVVRQPELIAGTAGAREDRGHLTQYARADRTRDFDADEDLDDGYLSPVSSYLDLDHSTGSPTAIANKFVLALHSERLRGIVEEYLNPGPDLDTSLTSDSPSSASLSTSDSRIIPTRGNADYAPPRKQLIFDLRKPPRSRGEAMKTQNHRCRTCGLKAESHLSKRFIFDEYLGSYCCTSCHQHRAKRIIPAYVIHCWDFKRRAVTDFSAQVLDETADTPAIDMKAHNKPACRRGVLLQAATLRQQLHHLKAYAATCRYNFPRSPTLEAHPHLSDEEFVYSLNELVALFNNDLLKLLTQQVCLGIDHIRNCELCHSRGYYCLICNSSEIIFPFELRKTTRCDKCKSVYHTKCFEKRQGACVMCARRAALAAKRATAVQEGPA